MNCPASSGLQVVASYGLSDSTASRPPPGAVRSTSAPTFEYSARHPRMVVAETASASLARAG